MEFDTMGNSKAFLCDPLGNVLNTTTNEFFAEKPLFYDGYGLPVWADEADSQRVRRQPFQYKGQFGYYTDVHTGLSYCHNRYYDPRMGRWLSRDPIGLAGGTNVYTYCSGDPVNLVDPSGLDWDWGQYGRDVWGVFKGYGQAIWGTVRSPVTAAEFLGTWSGNGWSADFGKKAASGAWIHFYGGLIGERGADGFGESFGSVLITVATAGSGFAEGGAFSKVATITRWDTPEGLAAIRASGFIKEGAFVQKGNGGPLNYLLSGALQQRYGFFSKIKIRGVPKSSLGAPPGREAFKWLLNQRVAIKPIRF